MRHGYEPRLLAGRRGDRREPVQFRLSSNSVSPWDNLLASSDEAAAGPRVESRIEESSRARKEEAEDANTEGSIEDNKKWKR